MLATRPLETEAKLAFAGVGDLLDGEHDSFGRLPEPQAHALRAALLLESPVAGTVDERAVGLGFLGVLRLLAAEQRVLVAVDDLQWLDLPSARALAFAGSRLGDICAGFLIALRAEERSRLAFAPERILPESVQAAGPRASARGDPSAAQGPAWSRPHTAGPKARARAGCWKPVLRARARPGRGCQAGCSPAWREAGRAVDGSRAGRSSSRRAAGGDAAVRCSRSRRSPTPGSTSWGRRSSVMPRPLSGRPSRPRSSRSWEVGSGSRTLCLRPPPTKLPHRRERREIHAALATLVGEREEQVRHLALAADGPDAAVAAALDEAAALARSRGAPVAAAELLEEARALTPAASEPRRGVARSTRHDVTSSPATHAARGLCSRR